MVFDKTLNVKNKDSVDDMYGKIFDILVWFLDNPAKNFVFNISPTNNLPHSKNPYFTGRTETLDLIYKNFRGGNSVSLIQSVKGLGGVGKTSIALEYAYSRFNEYRKIWWINAETEQNILNDYKSFGLRQKIISDDLKPDEIIDIIKNWFDTNENWLFIYDNADSADFNEWFEHYLPRINKRNILVTTRSNFFPKSNSIDITVFTKSESIEFLKKRTNKSGGGYSNELAKKLSEQLQYLPLALEQAAAYNRKGSLRNQLKWSYVVSAINSVGAFKNSS